MNRLNAWVLGATLLGLSCLAGCSTTAPSSPKGTLGTGLQAASARSIDFEVRAVASLATGNGQIVNVDPSGIVAQGAGNLVAQGAGNLVAQGAGNFGPMRGLYADSAQSRFLFVANAVVHFETLGGQKVSSTYLQSDANGAVHVNNLPDGQPTLCIAQWKENGQVYRTSAVINTGGVSDKIQLDPINHFLQARITSLVGQTGSMKSVSADQLRMAWTAFNDAGIVPDASLLLDSARPADLQAFYTNNVAKLPCNAQVSVRAVMAALGGEADTSCKRAN